MDSETQNISIELPGVASTSIKNAKSLAGIVASDLAWIRSLQSLRLDEEPP